MEIYHNSHKVEYRSPFGAVETGSSIQLQLDIYIGLYPKQVFLILENEELNKLRLKMDYEDLNGKRRYKIKTCIPQNPCLSWYYFEIDFGNSIIYYGNNEKNMGGEGVIYYSQPRPFQITVYPADYKTPEWFKKCIVYQIFADRFNNGNEDLHINNPKKNSFIYSSWEDTPVYLREGNNILRWEFFGGNLLGIEKKLDYLKELGIGAIYLNPIFESRSNHKYDTANYKNIDPMFGDEKSFMQLCRCAEERGISIILDGVFNHTGADSIYFNRFGNYDSKGACQSKDSPYYSWYKFEQYPDKYESWWGIGDLPSVSELDPTYMNYIIYEQDSVIEHWMSRGCRGWRLDVADELPDEFIAEFRKAMKDKDSQSVLIGEVWEDASNKISYGERKKYFYGGLLDSTTNYPLRNGIIDFVMGQRSADEFGMLLMSLYENYPRHTFYSMLNLIGGHDVPRILSILSGNKADRREELSEQEFKIALSMLKLAAILQMTLPGVPCIYYGDEAGCMGFDEPKNRGTYPWGRENMELLNWYKTITGLRNAKDVLKTGFWKTLHQSGRVLVYVRYLKNNRDEFDNILKDEVLIVVVNAGRDKENLKIDITDYGVTSLKSLFDGRTINTSNGIIDIDIEELEYMVLGS